MIAMIRRIDNSSRATILWSIAILATLVVTGKFLVISPILAIGITAIAVVLVAAPAVDFLCVVTFWVLPYLVVNLPTGVFTLKLPEVAAYSFCTAWLARALLRREQIAFPPATTQVCLYLAALCLSSMFASPIPIPYTGAVSALDRNSPYLRPMSLIIWLSLGWLVVIALYNTIGRRPDLFRLCLKGHILGGGVASLVSIIMYGLTLGGMTITNLGGAGLTRNLVPLNGSIFRLAGVSYEPLNLAFYLQTVIPVTLIAMMNQPKWLSMKLTTASFCLQVLTMILTFSSGGIAGIGVAFLFLFPLFRQQRIDPRMLRTLTWITIIGISSAVVVIIANPNVFLLVQSTLAKIFEGADLQRWAEWTTGWRQWLAHPLFGSGPGLGSFWFAKYSPTVVNNGLSPTMEVNSVPFNSLGETGLVGTLALGACVIFGMGRLLSAIKRRGMVNVPVLSAFAASLIGVGIQYLSLNSLFLIYFSVVIGIAVASERLAMTGNGIDVFVESSPS